MTALGRLVLDDLRAKAEWNYQCVDARALLKVLATDGTAAMVLYRLMQWAGRRRLSPLALIFNKLNAMFNNCIIGRGADFGPRFVLIHATGVVINGAVRGGSDVRVEHQVTIGAEGRRAPILGDHVFIGAGAKIIGSVQIGNGARIGANAVVVRDVPAHCTVVGVPARIVRRREPDSSTETPRPQSSAIALMRRSSR
jgi:serine O-acetyltransferase